MVICWLFIADTSTLINNKLDVLPDDHAIFDNDAQDICKKLPDSGYGAVVICVVLPTPDGHTLKKFVFTSLAASFVSTLFSSEI